MITLNQIKELSKKYKTNESVIAREYVQLSILKEIYSSNFSRRKRFSEDLDFTVKINEDVFVKDINKVFSKLKSLYPYDIKEKETIVGKTYLLSATLDGMGNPSYVRLDFSMRESVYEPVESILKTEYPILIQNFVSTISKNEILAEKFRAIINRKKHRDLYDIWLLLEIGADLDVNLINKKLAYYKETFDIKQVLNELDKITKEEFIIDIRPFVPLNERDKLGDFFQYVKAYVIKHLEGP